MIACKVCPGRVFLDEASYEQHTKTNKAHLKFVCPICSQGFPSAFARRGHLTKNHQDLLCRQCNRYYRSHAELQAHCRSDPSHPSCTQCESAFSDNATLAHHIKVEHPAPVLTCNACQLTFREQAELERHWKESRPHPLCLLCQRGLENTSAFDEHMKILHPDLYCGICGVGCQDEGQLQDHYRTADPDLHPLCDVCDKGFKSEAVLEEHILAVHQISPAETFSSNTSDMFCPQCDETFTHFSDLYAHYRDSRVHPTCIPCQKGFVDDYTYNEHLHTVHPTPTPCHTTPKAPLSALSPPRSLRSLIVSPRTQSPTTSRRPTPSIWITSPTFFATRSAGFSTPSGRGSPRAEHPEDTPFESDFDSATPFAASGPLPGFVGTSNSFLDPEAQQLLPAKQKLELRIPEPPCTITPLTPSALEETPTYASRTSATSTPELLPTPSSLQSYSPRSISPVHFARFSVSTTPVPSVQLPLEPAEIRIASCTHTPSLSTSSTPLSSPRVTHVSMPQADPEGDALTEGFEDAHTASPTSSESFTSLSGGTSDSDVEELQDVSPDRTETTVDACESPRSGEPVEDLEVEGDDTEPQEEEARDSPVGAANPRKEPVAAWHCRICMNEPQDPTATICGHVFCYECIVQELSKSFGCPVCKRIMLVRLDVD